MSEAVKSEARRAPSRRLPQIAVVAHTHPSISKGGAEVAAYALFRGLVEVGCEAVFVTACPHAELRRLSLGSAREIAIAYDPAQYDHFYHLGSAETQRRLLAVLRRENVRIANFHHFLHFGVNALRAVAAETPIRMVVTLHEFLAACHHHGQMVTRPARRLCSAATPQACSACFPEFSRTQFDLRRELVLSSLSAASGFISPSRFLAQRMIDWGLPERRVAVIENGLAAAAAPPAAQPLRRDTGRWVVGYFGQINPFKGVDTLLEAAELLGENPELAGKLRLRIHGQVIGQPDDFVARFNDTVERLPFLSFAGPYDNSEVGNLMAACDYVLVPSNWWENSPVVIQEAYRAGRPVICSGVGGMAEKVADETTGLHFRPGNAADLVRVLSLAADRGTFARLARNLPGVADARGMAEAYVAALEGFCRQEGKGEAA